MCVDDINSIDAQAVPGDVVDGTVAALLVLVIFIIILLVVIALLVRKKKGEPVL